MADEKQRRVDKPDLAGDVSDKERLVKADDDNTLHLENMKNVQGSNKDSKERK